MEIIHPKSAPATKSEVLGLTSLPSTQEDIKSGQWEVILPTQSFACASNIEFSAGSGAYATSLADSFVEVEFSVSTTTGSAVAATACSLANHFAHTLWSKITLLVNDTDVSASHRYYPHAAMLLALTSKNSSWAASGELEGFYKDTAGSMDDLAAANTGFVARKALITAAAVGDAAPVVSVAFRPYLGAFQQKKLIPDRTKLTLQLERARDNFALIHNNVAGAAITITRARWHVRRVELTEDASTALSRILLKEHALYSIDRVRCHQQTFRSSAFDFEQVLSGAIPTHVVIGFVSSAAAQGTATANPFNFQNLGLQRLHITAAGHNFPQQDFTPRFTGTALVGSRVAREYQTLLALAHKQYGPEGLLFSMQDYCGGYALYGFDLTPDLDYGHWSPSYRGDLAVHGEFTAQPGADVTLVVLSLTPSVFEISGEREVFKDW